MLVASRRIYIVGPSRAYNELFASYINERTGIACKEVSSPEELIQLLAKERNGRELILKDCGALVNDSFRERLQSLASHVSVDLLALFNLSPGTGIEKDAYAWGVKGFFYHSDTAQTLVKGVEALFNGELWMPRKVMSECLRQGRAGQRSGRRTSSLALTTRELDVLSKLVQGAPNKAIAEGLCVSQHTVKTHLYRIFRKIGAKNRCEATIWASNNL